MQAAELKSINQRLIQNITSLGAMSSGKQSSLQFNIWKQSIEERQQDEMVFSVLISAAVVVLGLVCDELISEIITLMRDVFYGTLFVEK